MGPRSGVNPEPPAPTWARPGARPCDAAWGTRSCLPPRAQGKIGGTADPSKRPSKIRFSASIEDDDLVVSSDPEIPALPSLRFSKVRLSQDDDGYWTVTGIVANNDAEVVDSVDVSHREGAVRQGSLWPLAGCSEGARSRIQAFRVAHQLAMARAAERHGRVRAITGLLIPSVVHLERRFPRSPEHQDNLLQ